jgi:hypothetical protein
LERRRVIRLRPHRWRCLVKRNKKSGATSTRKATKRVGTVSAPLAARRTMTDEERQEWMEWVQITSIPLHREDEAGAVVAGAIGCLIDYRGRRFLLSAHHAMQGERWFIVIGFDATAGQFEVYRPSAIVRVAETEKNWVNFRDLDFCFAEIANDVTSIFEHRTPFGVFSEARPRHVFQTDLTTVPNPESTYAFSGQIEGERHGPDWVSVHVTYPGLKYLRTERELHVFSLPVPHPGHVAFKGCSGAPIVDTEKRAVALLLSGNEENNTVSGISLAYLKTTLDLYCASFPESTST